MKKVCILSIFVFLFLTHYSEAAGSLNVKTEKARNAGPHDIRLDGIAFDSGGKIIESSGFEYGKTSEYGKKIKMNTWIGGTSEQKPDYISVHISNVPSNLSFLGDLDCSTKYHFRAFASTDVDTSVGEDKTFITKQCGSKFLGNTVTASIDDNKLPKVKTLPATEIGKNSAVFNGYLYDTGGESNLFFDFNYQKIGDIRNIGTGGDGKLSKIGPFSLKISEGFGLQCNTEYSFSTIVSSPNVQVDQVTVFSNGAVLKFKTLPCDTEPKKIIKNNDISRKEKIRTFFGKFKFW